MSRATKALEGRVAVCEEDSNLWKNKPFQEVRIRMQKCEEILNREVWNEERINVLGQAQKAID